MKRIRLFVFEGPEMHERTYSTLPVRIGRHPENDFQILDTRVSRFHAQIDCEGDELVLHDTDSVNGTFFIDGTWGRMLRNSDARSADGCLAFMLGPCRVQARLEEVTPTSSWS